MTGENASIAKITRPKLTGIFPRPRLFGLLDEESAKPVTWISAPAGSGKTTLIASWLDERKLPCLWYQLDEGDGDLASFFYYMGIAAKRTAPRYKKPLPLLTPEYLLGLSTFTKRWFENLFSRLKPPYIIVFDNYQDVPPDSGLHEVFRAGLTVIPDGIRVIAMSRSEPPPAFARFHASDKMSEIVWKNIKFTLEETKTLVENRSKKSISAAVAKRLYDATGGWASGLVLMMDRAEAGEDYARPDGELTREKVFDYFAGEVFEKLDSETRDFLLMASFLPRMTPETAAKLTDNEHAGKILSGLRRNHFFTEQHATAEAVYQFHPLFRSFLLARVKESLSREGVLRVQNRAAALLVETDQIEDAVTLFLEAGNWESAIRLILGNVQALMTQGRSKTLEAWLSSIPAEIVDATPWLLFWKASCRLPFDPAESRTFYERSFSLFKAGNDPVGSFLSCTGVMNTYLFQWNRFTELPRWINECEDLLKKYGEFPSKEIEIQVVASMFMAMFITQPQYTESAGWANKARMVIQTCPDNNVRVMVGSQLLWYFTMVSRISDSAAIRNEIGPLLRLPEITPLSRVSWYCLESIYGWVTASFDTCREAIRKGLEISDTTGVVVMKNKLFAQGAYYTVTTGDCKGSSEYLKKLASATDFNNYVDAGHYYHLASLDAFCRKDYESALELARKALDLVTGGGMPFAELICRTIFAQSLFHSGDSVEAGLQLAKAHALARDLKAVPLEFTCLLVESGFLSSRGNESSGKKALEILRQAMSMGREHNIMNISMMPRFDAAQYCATALEKGIEREYVRELIRAHKLTPPDEIAEFGVRSAESRELRAMGKPHALALENWPWPVKIYTLGRFELDVEGKTFPISRTQQKPLLMLKAMIAFGGEKVSEDRLTDALWPEAEGDVARKSFDTTLHRLRKLIGSDGAILINEGRLTLDPRQVWVDAWAFEKAVQGEDFGARSAGPEKNKSASSNPLSEIERAAALYRGHFLQTDTGLPWSVSMRERLRSKFLDLIITAGSSWEQKGRYAKAIEWFRRGLEIDELSERFYQQLMVCYQKIGQEAEAVATYERCCAMLKKSLGIGPSSRTEQIYRSVRRDTGNA